MAAIPAHHTKKYIEIVRTKVTGLSSMSQESCDAIYMVLSKQFNVTETLVDDLSDLEALVDRQPDLVFLGMELIMLNTALRVPGPNKIWISEYLDMHDIAYTGSSRDAHEFERNKPLAKQRIIEANLSTAAFCVIKQNQNLVEEDITLNYPLFIKPTNRGGGTGVSSDSVIHNFGQLQARARIIDDEFHSDSIVEEYLPGREFSVAILKNNAIKEYSVMPIELIAPLDKNGARLLSSQVKSSNTEDALEVTDSTMRDRIVTLALESFHALGARDYGRIDIRMDANGSPQFLEANLIPSLINGYGSFPKACVINIGLEYDLMIETITDLGLARNLNDTDYPVAISGIVVADPV